MTNRPGGAGEDGSVRAACARYGGRPDALIEIMIDLQDARGCIADADVAEIADALNLSRAEVHGVRSFYSDFSAAPRGRSVVRLCRAEACQAVGSEALAADLESRLGLRSGETSEDGVYSLEAVYCLGNCALGPAAMVNGRLIARADAGKILKAAEADNG